MNSSICTEQKQSNIKNYDTVLPGKPVLNLWGLNENEDIGTLYPHKFFSYGKKEGTIA
jgi:hypothetical protein